MWIVNAILMRASAGLTLRVVHGVAFVIAGGVDVSPSLEKQPDNVCVAACAGELRVQREVK